MARPERFELPTSWFVAMRSIQLSYGRSTANDRRLQSRHPSAAAVSRALREPDPGQRAMSWRSWCRGPEGIPAQRFFHSKISRLPIPLNLLPRHPPTIPRPMWPRGRASYHKKKRMQLVPCGTVANCPARARSRPARLKGSQTAHSSLEHTTVFFASVECPYSSRSYQRTGTALAEFSDKDTSQ